ncbi:hypothetical protein WA158_007993 [Blastocystis sp. Blastoise]
MNTIYDMDNTKLVKNIAEDIKISISEQVARDLSFKIEYRLKELIQDASKFMIHSKRDTLQVSDVKNALQLRKIDTIYGFSSKEVYHFEQHKVSPEVALIKNETIKLVDIINAPAPDLPQEMTFHMHWLSVEGVQPCIPENPPSKHLINHHNPPKEDKLVAISPVSFHSLSSELNYFFLHVKESLNSVEEPIRIYIYNSLRKDRGLHQLIPYLLQHIISQIKFYIKTKPKDMLMKLFSYLYASEALLNNPNINIQPYLHLLIPAILSCLLAKTLSFSPIENHWELREKAAQVLRDICTQYSLSYPELQKRITINISEVFQKKSSLPAIYGAIVCLYSLGPRAISSILLKIYPSLTEHLETIFKSSSILKQIQARHCIMALNRVLGSFILSQYYSLFGSPTQLLLEDVTTSLNSLPPSDSIRFIDYIYPYTVQPNQTFWTMADMML